MKNLFTKSPKVGYYKDLSISNGGFRPCQSGVFLMPKMGRYSSLVGVENRHTIPSGKPVRSSVWLRVRPTTTHHWRSLSISNGGYMPNIAISAPALSIGSSEICEKDGLYSLNDLHRISGGASKHLPKNFVRLVPTQTLIEELTSSNPRKLKSVVRTGKGHGTYVCKELAIAYAAWISPAFHLKVIRVFLNHYKPQVVPAISAPKLKYDFEYARKIIDEKRQWAMGYLDGVNRQKVLDWCREMERFSVNCWTELDEISSHLIAALAMVRRARGTK